MGIKEILDKVLGKKEEEEPYTLKELIDRRLDVLRYERQKQINEMEKERLKQEIAMYHKKKQLEAFGVKHSIKQKSLIEGKKARVNLMQKARLSASNKQKNMMSTKYRL